MYILRKKIKNCRTNSRLKFVKNEKLAKTKSKMFEECKYIAQYFDSIL